MSAARVAIVTGASSGIGRALAERAVRAGWHVFAVGRRAQRLEELAAMLGTASGSLATLALDLREPGAAARIVRETLETFGRIDVLVNNAGGVAVGPIAEQNDEALYDQMETHVIVPLALTREALPALRSSRGLVIFFGSGVARIPVGTLGAYPAAKAAVRSLSRTARNELRPAGIAVTYVDPGAVATEFMTRAGFAGPPASIAASPYDVARAVFAAFTTRQPIVNAVPWQTFFVALGEAFPKLTDYLLTKAPGIVGGDALPPIPEKLAFATTAVAASDATAGLAETHAFDDVVATTTSDATTPHETSDPSVIDPTTIEPTIIESTDVADVADVADVDELRPPAMQEELVQPDVRDAGDTTIFDVPNAKEPVVADLGVDPDEIVEAGPTTFAAALAPHEGRMKKLNLREPFVRGLLVPGVELDLGYVAMRWAGMPNKNERGLTSDVLESLAAAGFLERIEAERFLVVREADE